MDICMRWKLLRTFRGIQLVHNNTPFSRDGHLHVVEAALNFSEESNYYTIISEKAAALVLVTSGADM